MPELLHSTGRADGLSRAKRNQGRLPIDSLASTMLGRPWLGSSMAGSVFARLDEPCEKVTPIPPLRSVCRCRAGDTCGSRRVRGRNTVIHTFPDPDSGKKCKGSWLPDCPSQRCLALGASLTSLAARLLIVLGKFLEGGRAMCSHVSLESITKGDRQILVMQSLHWKIAYRRENRLEHAGHRKGRWPECRSRCRLRCSRRRKEVLQCGQTRFALRSVALLRRVVNRPGSRHSSYSLRSLWRHPVDRVARKIEGGVPVKEAPPFLIAATSATPATPRISP